MLGVIFAEKFSSNFIFDSINNGLATLMVVPPRYRPFISSGSVINQSATFPPKVSGMKVLGSHLLFLLLLGN